ncbi:flagellar hook-associated protein FlgK, partial [Thioclava sp. BHET1]
MTLSSALSTAISGLDSTSVWSDVTSSNIANANTDGYVRKDVTVVSNAGGSITTAEVQREVDASLDRMYRLQASKMNTQQTIYEGVQAYTSILGQPDDEISPVSKLTDLQTSLTTLANTPSSAAAQRGVLDAADAMASSLNDASDTLGEVKDEVTTEIKYNVSDVNQALYKIADINKQLSGAGSNTSISADLQDQLSQLVEQVSGAMDVQVSTGSNGQVSLYTSGGTALIDGTSVSDLSYNESTGKLLAGKTEITPGASGVRGFDDGTLAGLFQLKDQILPTFQTQLDTMAANLIQGFQGADSSLSSGQAGLFTDAGATYDPANLQGLAGRISVNAAADPAQGGTLSLIRDGLGATTPGDASDATQVNAFLDVFNAAGDTGTGTDLPDGLDLLDYASNMVSYQQTQGTAAQANYNNLATSAQTIDSSRQSVQGVNLDDELQKLIVIQHSYAANSKMMST